MDTVTMIIVPEPGQLKPVAQLLLQLADHPSQVATVSHPELGFAVPKKLFDLFEAAYKTSDDTPKPEHVAPDVTVKEPVEQHIPALVRSRPEVDPGPELAPKRRPGRPRKTQGKE